jgi:hypothetical protein
VAPIKIVAPDVRVDLRYADRYMPPSQTEVALLDGGGTVVMDLRRIADTATVYGVPVARYMMSLGYDVHGATLLDKGGTVRYGLTHVKLEPLDVRVEAGLVTTVTADLSGELEGSVRSQVELTDAVDWKSRPSVLRWRSAGRRAAQQTLQPTNDAEGL